MGSPAAGNHLYVRVLRLPGPPRPSSSSSSSSSWLGSAALGLGLGALALGLGLGALALGKGLWRRLLRAGRGPRRPRRQVGTVSELWIYPLKSGQGVAVGEAECTPLGLRSGGLRDRCWLVVNDAGSMVTARQEPRLVLVSLTCEGDALALSAPDMQDLPLPLEAPATNPVLKCRVHGLEIQGRDCGEAAAHWITSFLKSQPYRLVHFEPHMAPRKSHQIKDVFGPADQVAYSDASPLLILSEASLADLNSRLEKRVKATNFRPNIVVSGCRVYAEDSWHQLLIGDVELRRVMACTSYRLCDDPSQQKLYGKSPLFGQYLVPENPGTIRVGDAVYLLDQ